mgnify:CR=1 FL=1|tara:strand:- start:6234 stop:6989 length:756 start_codon:yes stop_codon:yes gene_type:complete
MYKPKGVYMFYTIYKITNTVNNKIYIGQHQTEKLDDGYMGSGTYLKRAKLKYGIDKFEKEIIYIFDTKIEMDLMESKLVDKEFVDRLDTYNIATGGPGGTQGQVTVSCDGVNYINVDKDDPRYTSGEYKQPMYGKVAVIDEEGNKFVVDKDDPRYISGVLFCTGRPLSDKQKNQISEFMKGNEHWLGKRHSEESKKKIGEANSIYQSGRGNSQYGTCWVYNSVLKQSKKIKKEELQYWIDQGWLKGRKIKF